MAAELRPDYRRIVFPAAVVFLISTITTYPFVIATRPQSQFKSLADLIARSKAEPGKTSYSSTGIGTAGHLLGEWFSAEAGIERQ